MRRFRISRRKSRSNFRRSASRIKAKNLRKFASRGGYQL